MITADMDMKTFRDEVQYSWKHRDPRERSLKDQIKESFKDEKQNLRLNMLKNREPVKLDENWGNMVSRLGAGELWTIWSQLRSWGDQKERRNSNPEERWIQTMK